MSTPSQAVPAVFAFESHNVRAIMRDNEPWFVAADVCLALDIANPTQAIQRLDDDERSMFNIGRQGNAHIINESGLYSLILGSRKPEAKRFKKWITSEVLPSLRKTGSYHMAVPATQPAPVAANLYPPSVLTFNGVPVFTYTRLADAFGLDRSTLRGNLVAHPHDFKVGLHYFKLSGTALRNFLLANMHTGEVNRRSCRQLVIWSQDGIEAHARLFPPNIAQRGRQAIADHLAGDSTQLIDDDADLFVPPPIAPPRIALASGTPARIVLTFANAAALGAAMSELLALTSRHAVSLSMEGGAA